MAGRSARWQVGASKGPARPPCCGPDRWGARLREFRGTVVMVSHDTWFAEAVGVDRRWRLGDGRLVEEAG
ncbi:hypothetical protein [Micromonospora chersina]|uniref:hypothetical protein n=1 Tax=Micromonospora chersina TaxID=47854 RepID=UPI003711F00B